MLKKLAKYGNSTALVIDKAILELLEIDDATMVKLHTDGKSLIITPVKADQLAGKVSYGSEEAMGIALNKFREDNLTKYEALSADQKAKIEAEKDNSSINVQKEISDLYLKYNEPFKRFIQKVYTSTAYQDEVTKLAEKYDPVAQNVEYIKAFNQLKYNFVPELEKMDQEMAEISKKYTPGTAEFAKKNMSV